MDEKQVIIKFSIKSISAFIAIIILGLFLFELRELALVVITALVFSLALEPLKKFLRKIRIPETLSILIVFLVIISTFSLMVYSVIPIISQQLVLFLEDLPSILSSLRNIFKGTVLEVIASQLFSLDTDISKFKDIFISFSQFTGQGVYSIFKNFFYFILFLVLTFLFSVNNKKILEIIILFVPTKNAKYVIDFWKRIEKKFGGWLQGQLILIISIGILTYIALVLIGIENALLLAMFAGLLEIIPIFGPILGAIPATLLALATGDLTTVVLVIVAFVVIQQIESHFIHPLVVNKMVGLNTLLIILSVVIGVSLAGFLGAILAIPFAIIAQEIVSELTKKKKEVLKDQGLDYLQ